MQTSGSQYHTILRRAAVAVAVLAAPFAADAQAANYPAFQPPRIVGREYTVGVADGSGQTSLVFQWREAWSPVSQLSFDVGVADPDGGANVRLLLGGGYARQLNVATSELPLDLTFTTGVYASLADPFIFSVPAGISIGHRFPLEGGFAITPYLHPRVALQYCNDCRIDGSSDSDLGVAFDLGADFEVSPRLSLRAAVVFGDDDADAIGFGLAWRPAGLR